MYHVVDSNNYKNELSSDEYRELRKSVGWGELCKEQAQGCVDGADYVVKYTVKDRVVGAARVFWDKGYIAYISDVMVRPEYQGNGIGKGLVNKCIEYVDNQLKPDWRIKIVLLASKNNEDFYTRMGFAIRPNEKYGPGMDMWRKY